MARLSVGERAGSTISMGSLNSQDMVEYQDLGPFMDPGAVLQTVVRVLAAANVAKRQELDWQAQNEVRMLHSVCVKNVDVRVLSRECAVGW